MLWYSEVQQESTAEVGSRLGLRPNAVAALAYRAREGLRQAFLQAHVSGCDDEACRATVAQLGGWTRDRLSTGDAARVDAHLASCRRCRQVAAELAEVNSGLRGLLAPLLLGGSSGASGVAVSAGAVGTAAGSTGAVSACAVSAGAVSAGAAGAMAGGSVLGWLAGAHAGQAAAVLTALVVGGTAVAAGVAVPGALHRSPAASAVTTAQDSGGGIRSEFAPIPPGGSARIELRNTPSAAPKPARDAAKAAKKQAKAEAKVAKKATVPNPPSAATGGPAAKPNNPNAAAAGSGQTEPNNPDAAAAGSGQTEPNNPNAAAPGNGQTEPPNPEAGAAGNGQVKPNTPKAAAPGQNKPRNAQANGHAAAVGKGTAHRAAGG